MTGQQAIRAVGFSMSCGVLAQMIAADYGMPDPSRIAMPTALVVLALFAIIWRLGE